MTNDELFKSAPDAIQLLQAENAKLNELLNDANDCITMYFKTIDNLWRLFDDHGWKSSSVDDTIEDLAKKILESKEKNLKEARQELLEKALWEWI